MFSDLTSEVLIHKLVDRFRIYDTSGCLTAFFLTLTTMFARVRAEFRTTQATACFCLFNLKITVCV